MRRAGRDLVCRRQDRATAASPTRPGRTAWAWRTKASPSWSKRRRWTCLRSRHRRPSTSSRWTSRARSSSFRPAEKWVERVRVMKVETHEPYSQEACLHDLGRIGFSARPGRHAREQSSRVGELRPFFRRQRPVSARLGRCRGSKRCSGSAPRIQTRLNSSLMYAGCGFAPRKRALPSR